MVYKTLFNIDVLHAYFLDRGDKKFHAADLLDELSTEEKEDAEKNYNVNDCIQIVADQNTKDLAKNYKLLLRNHHKGIRVLASSSKITIKDGLATKERYSPFIKLSDDLTLTFYIKVSDNYFENYTDIIDKKENQLYYISNKNSTASNVFAATSAIVTWDNFLISAKESRRLVYELEKEKEFLSNTPKRVSIAAIDSGEIDAIEAKVIATTALNEDEQEIFDALNQTISVLKNSKVIGIVQLKISGDNDTDFTEILNAENPSTGDFDLPKQCLLADEIHFKIYIENKKTFWRYNQKSKSQIMVTNTTHPLTKNGKVELTKTDVTPQPSDPIFFPNPSIQSITKDATDYYSEIHI